MSGLELYKIQPQSAYVPNSISPFHSVFVLFLFSHDEWCVPTHYYYYY